MYQTDNGPEQLRKSSETAGILAELNLRLDEALFNIEVVPEDKLEPKPEPATQPEQPLAKVYQSRQARDTLEQLRWNIQRIHEEQKNAA